MTVRWAWVFSPAADGGLQPAQAFRCALGVYGHIGRTGGVSRPPPYLEWMMAAPGDSTEDWLLPEHSRPPLIGELERRVELALTMARASEAAVVTVGAAAISAAEQAERAAGIAEKASATALQAQNRVAAMTLTGPTAPSTPTSSAPPAEAKEDDSLSDFTARADRLVARLRQLQRVPLPAPASGAAGRPQAAH